MTTYIFPPTDKTLYGLTTDTVYKPLEGAPGLWDTGDLFITFDSLFEAEPDGVTDIRPLKVGDTISTVEELEALPDGAILRDESGAWMKDRGCFLLMWTRVLYPSSGLAYDNMLTIVWLPETGERA